MISDTSMKAYRELIGAGVFQPRELQVLQALAEKPLTRDEIAAATGLRLSSVCGRVNSLVKAGAIVSFGERRSTETGKLQELLWIKQ